MASKVIQQFPPLELENRPTVSTAACGFYLHLKVATLKIYSFKGTGPLRPIRIGNRLHWRTEDIRRLLAGSTI